MVSGYTPEVKLDVDKLLIYEQKQEIAKLKELFAESKRRIVVLQGELKYPPTELLAKWMDNELADYAMVLRHCSEVYGHFSGGRISKPQTYPSEVFSVAEEIREEEIAEDVADETERLHAELDELKAKLPKCCRFCCQVAFVGSKIYHDDDCPMKAKRESHGPKAD